MGRWGTVGARLGHTSTCWIPVLSAMMWADGISGRRWSEKGGIFMSRSSAQRALWLPFYKLTEGRRRPSMNCDEVLTRYWNWCLALAPPNFITMKTPSLSFKSPRLWYFCYTGHCTLTEMFIKKRLCQVKGSEIDAMYWTDRAMERSWICADLGLKTLFCYYKPWHKLKKKNWCFFGQKHPSGFGSRVSVVLGSIPKLQWMPLIRAHMSSPSWTWLLIKTKQNKTK